MSNDPIQSLQRSAEGHDQKHGFFKFLHEHLIPDEVYRLTETDLSRLEIR